MLFQPIFTLLDIQSDTASICAAFHVIIPSDCSDFTFPDQINDVQGEDEKHQSTVEVAGSLIGELPAVTLGDVILPNIFAEPPS